MGAIYEQTILLKKTKSFILLKYRPFSTQNNNWIISLEGNKAFAYFGRNFLIGQ